MWFTGTSPTGPWTVANSVPQEIYSIPASNPAHHVTYVTVEDDDDNDEWVTFAAAAGYTGMMMACMRRMRAWTKPTVSMACRPMRCRVPRLGSSSLA